MRLRNAFTLLGLFSLLTQPTWSDEPMADKTTSPEIAIIPQPAELILGGDHFTLTTECVIIAGTTDETERLGQILAEWLAPATGKALEVQEEIWLGDLFTPPLPYIWLTTHDANAALGPEGYELVIKPGGIEIRASQPQGLFYGIQSLRQLLPAGMEAGKAPVGPVTLPCLTIRDTPRLPWRGMLLDSCRHFMTKDFVKRYIDLLAYYKMNRLHWHLTEDQGWRVQIDAWPRLTEVGAWRDEGDGRYGGFYTKDDIREIVAYASSRYVTIIPEIEMPGHSLAALAAYPEFSCTGGPFQVSTKWGIFEDIYCAGKEETFRFLESVLDEVVELFPAAYIHLGADEAPKDRWENCPDCQRRIKEEILTDERELQTWFINRIGKYLAGKGRRVICWDEIFEGGLPGEMTVQVWRDGGDQDAVARVAEAAKGGFDVISSPTSHCYFNEGVDRISLAKVYTFDPMPEGLTADEARHVLGGECNMWTEYAPQEAVDGQMFPRMLAFTEAVWSPVASRDYAAFHQRVEDHYKRLTAMGVTFGPEDTLSQPAQ